MANDITLALAEIEEADCIRIAQYLNFSHPTTIEERESPPTHIKMKLPKSLLKNLKVISSCGKYLLIAARDVRSQAVVLSLWNQLQLRWMHQALELHKKHHPYRLIFPGLDFIL